MQVISGKIDNRKAGDFGAPLSLSNPINGVSKMTADNLPRPLRRNRTTPEKFWKRSRILSNGCWEWTGSLATGGYGMVSFEGKCWRAHRLAYFFHYQKLPDLVLHSCDNKKCINPAHLRDGTKAENGRESVARGQQCIGSAKPVAKLNEAMVWRMRVYYYVEGFSYSAIHQLYPFVGRDAVRRAVSGICFKHVPMPTHPASDERMRQITQERDELLEKVRELEARDKEEK